MTSNLFRTVLLGVGLIVGVSLLGLGFAAFMDWFMNAAPPLPLTSR